MMMERGRTERKADKQSEAWSYENGGVCASCVRVGMLYEVRG